jgi:hypothetical protein
MNSTELWSTGMYLSDAWFRLASPEEKENYRASGDKPARTAFLEDMMRGEIISRIRDGELSCLGVQIAPGLGTAPEVMPAFLFTQPNIDWNSSIVSAYGRTFEGVRVITARDSLTGKNLNSTPKPKGRPTVGPAISQVIQELIAKGALSDISRKQQETIVRKRARERFPHLFLQPTSPSRSKILEALRAAGL